MKTIRQNTFETNSSSTHALSLYSSKLGNRDVTFIASDDPVVVNVGGWLPFIINDSITEKIKFVVSYLFNTNQTDKLQEFQDAFNAFSPRKLEIVFNAKYEPCGVDSLDDYFSIFTCEYGHDGVEDFKVYADAIVKNADTMLDFVFTSANGWESESYYDG